MDYKEPINQRLFQCLTNIQYGKIEHPWAIPIDTILAEADAEMQDPEIATRAGGK